MKTIPLELSYDPQVDALTVYFQPRRPGMSAYTVPLDDRRLVDYDEHDQVVAVELLHVSEGVNLQGLPEGELIADVLARLADAHRLSA